MSPLCTLSHNRKTSSFPVQEPPTLSMRHIFNSAAHGASVEHMKQYTELTVNASLFFQYYLQYAHTQSRIFVQTRFSIL